MIKIKQNSCAFQLSISNYEFPESDDKEETGNWLVIHIEVQQGELKWARTQAVLLTWDVERIIKWLDYLSQGHQPTYGDIREIRQISEWDHLDPSLKPSDDIIQQIMTHQDQMAKSLDFTEPNLAFEYSPTEVGAKLKIKFELEFLPIPWKEWEELEDDKECSIEFDLSFRQLAEIKDMFVEELRKFPKRV